MILISGLRRINNMIKIYKFGKLILEGNKVYDRKAVIDCNIDNRGIRVENWKDGKRDGEWIVYYENGNVREERNYRNGELI